MHRISLDLNFPISEMRISDLDISKLSSITAYAFDFNYVFSSFYITENEESLSDDLKFFHHIHKKAFGCMKQNRCSPSLSTDRNIITKWESYVT